MEVIGQKFNEFERVHFGIMRMTPWADVATHEKLTLLEPIAKLAKNAALEEQLRKSDEKMEIKLTSCMGEARLSVNAFVASDEVGAAKACLEMFLPPEQVEDVYMWCKSFATLLNCFEGEYQMAAQLRLETHVDKLTSALAEMTSTSPCSVATNLKALVTKSNDDMTEARPVWEDARSVSSIRHLRCGC